MGHIRTQKDTFLYFLDSYIYISMKTIRKGDGFMAENIKKSKKTQIIKGRVTEEKFIEVQKFVEEKGFSVSSLVAVAVTEYINKNR